MTNFIRHKTHRLVNVIEEGFVAGAQIIQPWLTSGRFNETILGTAAIAYKPHLTFSAVTRQCIAFGQPKETLLLRANQINQRDLTNVAQLMFWLDKVIARI